MNHFRKYNLNRYIEENSGVIPTYSSLYSHNVISDDIVNSLYSSPSGPIADMTKFKGDFNERFMDLLVTKRELGFNENLYSITPHTSEIHGIDGIYLPQEGPLKIVVIEAKFGTSRLANTINTGRQMSESWLNNRLENLSFDYNILSNRITDDGIKIYEELPFAKQRADFVWELPPINDNEGNIYEYDGNLYYEGNTELSSEKISKSIENISKILNAGASDRIKVQPYLFKFLPDGNHWKTILCSLDENGYELKEIINESNSFSELDHGIKHDMRENLKKLLVSNEVLEKHVNELTDSILNNPESLKNINTKKELESTFGLEQGLTAGFLSGALVTLFTYLGSSGANRSSVAIKFGMSAAFSTIVGHEAGIRLTEFFETTEFGEEIIDNFEILGNQAEEIIGGIGGGLIAGTVFQISRFIFIDNNIKYLQRGILRAGTRFAISSTATTATITGVSAFAHASTGTAISTLHGAAAHNAAMAWLGGGSLASGGGGIAVGTLVLGGISIGVGFAAGLIFKVVVKHLDFTKQRRYLEGKIDLTERILKASEF